MLKIMYPNCCGIDVHKSFVVAVVAITDNQGITSYHRKRFSTFTNGLVQLRDWLEYYSCFDVCMESTGKYWIPVFNILEESCNICLAHPKYVKAIRGKKTDKKDAQWIADLFKHDLVASSFIPPLKIRQLRDLFRYRMKLILDKNQKACYHISMKLTKHDEKTIKSLLKDTSKAKFHKRLQIILFRSKGKTHKEITDLLDCNPSTVSRTLAKFEKDGLGVLLQETRGGRNRSYLTLEEEKQFLAQEFQAAITGEHVTIDKLHQAYQERVGKKTTRAGFYSFLARHGWRKLSPRPEHPKKADAQTIVASKNKIYFQETKKAL